MSLSFTNVTPNLATSRGRAEDDGLSSTAPFSTPSSSSTISSLTTSPTVSPSSILSEQASLRSNGPNIGLILGVLFGTIAFLGLVLLAIRFWFIKRRQAHQESGARLAYTKAKAVGTRTGGGAGGIQISGPTDFRVVESGLAGLGGSNGSAGQYPFGKDSTRANEGVYRTTTMESGLSTHMETMKKSVERKPAPVIMVQSVTVTSDR